MLLTEEEFSRIRPLRWASTAVGDRLYQTTADAIDTRLFWLDFLRLVFAPKFRQQEGVPQVADFDVDRQVLLTDGLELTLPTQLEAAMYCANNPTPPVSFVFTSLSQTAVLIVALLTVFLIVVASALLRVPFSRII